MDILYSVGIGIGSSIMVICLSLYLFFYYKNYKLKKHIQKIGEDAEQKINEDIAAWTKYNKMKFLKSSTYKYDGNQLFEVDSIVVTDKAIIVVEIKSIKGDVVGDAKEKIWKKISLNNGEFDIKNPIKQNDKHIKHILKLLKIQVPIISLIIFSDETNNMTLKNTPSHALVIKHKNLYNKLNEVNEVLKPAINSEERKFIYKKLLNSQTLNSKDLKKHLSIATKGY